MKAFSLSYIAQMLILLIPIPFSYGDDSKFEVVSIRPAPPIDPGLVIDRPCFGGPGTKDPSRWTCSNVALPNLVVQAFHIKGFALSAVSSVPKEQFTILAKIPDGATKEQFEQMQLNLLVERFGLKFHREKTEMQGYELTIAKDGPKLKESEPELPTDADTDLGMPHPISLPKIGRDGFPILPRGKNEVVILVPRGRARGQWIGTTMEEFAGELTGTGLANKPIIDATGLKGKYDISLTGPRISATPCPCQRLPRAAFRLHPSHLWVQISSRLFRNN